MTKIIAAPMIAAILSMLPMSSFHANAQRTMDRQSAICIDASYNGMSFGMSAEYSRYTLNGFWCGGVTFNDYKAELSAGGILRYEHIVVCGGYMFRIAGTRDRSINLYGGGNVFIGAEMADPSGKVPPYLSLPMGNGFLYGISPEMMIEFFVTAKLALVATAALPVNFSSVAGAVNFNIGAGMKIML